MDLSLVLDCLAEAAAKALSADAAAVLLVDAAKDCLTVAAVYGMPLPPGTRAVALPATWEPVVVGDASVNAQGIFVPEGFSGSCLSLTLGEPPLGVLCVYDSRLHRFDSGEAERFQALADLGAVAIQASYALVDLKQVEASKSQFVHVATHELRSPITTSQSLIKTVLQGYAGSLTEKQQDIFDRISRRLDFLEGLVNDLLDLAASKTPSLGENRPALVNSSVGRAVLLLQPRAEEKGVALVHQVCCEELVVWANDEGLDRIFVNLVGNAVKYTPAGGRVTVALEHVGEAIRIAVTDTGIGIPEEALDHLFEEFYRAPNARTLDVVGTGLGLAIVKDLVDQYGGDIAVQSVEGAGSTFTVTLPLYHSG